MDVGFSGLSVLDCANGASYKVAQNYLDVWVLRLL